jgi:hypothetical protein
MIEKPSVRSQAMLIASLGVVAGLAILLSFGLWNSVRNGRAVATAFTTETHAAPPERRSSVDPHGWDKITWGMSFDEIQRLYGAAAMIKRYELSNPGFGRESAYVVIKGIEIGRMHARAEVRCLGCAEKRATSVLLSVSDANPKRTPSLIFEDLQLLLLAKYGQPETRDRTQNSIGVQETISWLCPSTLISLIWQQSARFSFLEYVNIRYRATEQTGIDKL